MSFKFSRHGLEGHEKFLQRAFEILPGLTSWTILIGMTALSFWNPVAAAVIIIAFYVYWLMRVFYVVFFLVLAICVWRWRVKLIGWCGLPLLKN